MERCDVVGDVPVRVVHRVADDHASIWRSFAVSRRALSRTGFSPRGGVRSSIRRSKGPRRTRDRRVAGRFRLDFHHGQRRAVGIDHRAVHQRNDHRRGAPLDHHPVVNRAGVRQAGRHLLPRGAGVGRRRGGDVLADQLFQCAESVRLTRCEFNQRVAVERGRVEFVRIAGRCARGCRAGAGWLGGLPGGSPEDAPEGEWASARGRGAKRRKWKS